jgi:hypothetical protein
MARRRHAAPPLRVALLLAAARTAAALFGRADDAGGPTSKTFIALSDWGGTDQAPFTTPSQQAVASAMQSVGVSTDLSFVVSAGNNFMPGGLQGATLRVGRPNGGGGARGGGASGGGAARALRAADNTHARPPVLRAAAARAAAPPDAPRAPQATRRRCRSA